MYLYHISRESVTMILGTALLTALLGGVTTGCTATGRYDPNSRHLETATQAFFSQDWPLAGKGFKALAVRTDNPKAVIAGRYGLVCLEMATAPDIPAFLKALSMASPSGAEGFRDQNPALFILGASHGIRLMEERQKAQADRILKIRREKEHAVRKIQTLEQTVKKLRHQIKAIERIDQELQEKRNPL